MSPIRVVVVGSEIPALRPGTRVIVRPSILEALGFIRRTRPELVLLPRALWGWARAVAIHSPETLVFPADAPPRAVA